MHIGLSINFNTFKRFDDPTLYHLTLLGSPSRPADIKVKWRYKGKRIFAWFFRKNVFFQKISYIQYPVLCKLNFEK